jgi:hypothetical protein
MEEGQVMSFHHRDAHFDDLTKLDGGQVLWVAPADKVSD